MADITLINLNMLLIRYVDSVEKELHIPLGPLYLTSVLEQAGISTDFRDYQACVDPDPFDVDKIADFCLNPAPIIGLSCMANLLPFTILAAKKLKAVYPDRIILLGGVGPMSVEEEILKRFPWIDIVGRGEGERSLPPLVRALQEHLKTSTGSGTERNREREGDFILSFREFSFNDVPGIFFRQNGKIISTPPAQRITNLDAIPFPAFERIDLKNYEGYGMVTSRGCPYLCTFCSVAPIWGRTPYVRSAQNIIREMSMLHESAGVNLFLFQDEYFVSSKERVIDFCKALKKSALGVRFKAFGRVDLTDRETMEAMAEAGCIEIRYGIESGSSRILQKTRKGFDREQAIEIVSEAVKIFPRVDCFFIWGFPFETMDDFLQTLFLMISFRLMGARVLPSLFCMLPQTDIYKEVGGKLKMEFSPTLLPEYMRTGHEVIHTGKISTTEVHPELFDFISRNPDMFPGFFLHDIAGNVFPKFRILQEHGFYSRAQRSGLETSPLQKIATDLDSCGGHSPRT